MISDGGGSAPRVTARCAVSECVRQLPLLGTSCFRVEGFYTEGKCGRCFAGMPRFRNPSSFQARSAESAQHAQPPQSFRALSQAPGVVPGFLSDKPAAKISRSRTPWRAIASPGLRVGPQRAKANRCVRSASLKRRRVGTFGYEICR